MSDLISRQAAAEVIYKALKTPVFHFPDYRKDPFHDTMGLAFAMANEIPSAQPEQRWIPCSERLPELDVPIVFTTAIGTLDVGFRIDANTLNQFYSETGKCRRDNDDVIAWQPLPEPYKADMNNPLQNTQLH